jgi:hypothetical protein
MSKSSNKKKGKYFNTKKLEFIKSIPKESLESSNCNISDRCKFNFSFFDNSQVAGQDFKDWADNKLAKLCNKLKDYSRESLAHWQNIPMGSGEHRLSVLAIYGDFPNNSDFSFPKSIPSEAMWGRFRLEQSTRLVGFTLPFEYNEKCSQNKNSDFNFDCNTFYIVFLDENHKFYKTEKK